MLKLLKDTPDELIYRDLNRIYRFEGYLMLVLGILFCVAVLGLFGAALADDKGLAVLGGLFCFGVFSAAMAWFGLKFIHTIDTDYVFDGRRGVLVCRTSHEKTLEIAFKTLKQAEVVPQVVETTEGSYIDYGVQLVLKEGTVIPMTPLLHQLPSKQQQSEEVAARINSFLAAYATSGGAKVPDERA
jgi:hypothetical protein